MVYTQEGPLSVTLCLPQWKEKRLLFVYLVDSEASYVYLANKYYSEHKVLKISAAPTFICSHSECQAISLQQSLQFTVPKNLFLVHCK